MPRVRRAIIMAAGIGKRMQPLTLTTPKPLISVNNTRMIDSAINGLHKNGIFEIYIVVGYLKEQFYQLERQFPGVKIIENPYYETCNNISSLYVARDYIEEAIVAYNKAIALNPEYSIAYNNLGVIYLDDIGNVNEAIRLFDKAVEGNKAYALAYFNLGRSYAILKENTTAAQYFQKALDYNILTEELDEEDIRYRLHKLFEV